MTFKVIGINDAGTIVQFGGDDVDKIDRWLSGVDLSSTELPDINTITLFRDQKLRLNDPTNTRKLIFKTTSGMSTDRQAIFPALSANDTFLFANQTQTITGKTMDYNSNTFVNFPSSGGGGDMTTNTNQTVSGIKTFGDAKFALRNPADTFSATVSAGAQTAARTFTFPVTSSDTIATIAATQTLTNKGIDGAANTITNIPKSAIPSTTLYGDIDNAFGAHFFSMSTMLPPSAPSSGLARFYLDSADNHFKIKHASGSVTDVDALGAPSSSPVQFGGYIIYIDGAGRINALNGVTGIIDYSSASAPATATETTTLFQNVADAIKPTGGLIYIKRGVYQFTGVSWIVGDSVTYPNTTVVIKGEGIDATVLQATGANGWVNGLVRIQCNCVIEDLTVDANYVTGATTLHALFMSWATGHIWANRCKFQKATNLCFRVSTAAGVRVSNCWFAETTASDQLSQGAQDYAIITNNMFDKSTATGIGATNGSCITNGGSAKNILIANNIFLRIDAENGGENAISVEAFSVNHAYYLITGNICKGGRLYIGGQSSPSNLATDNTIMITNNLLHEGGAIQIDSSSDSWPNTDINNIHIVGNTVYHSNWGGIMLLAVNGPTVIRDNTIIDWNYSDVASTSRCGIYMTMINDVEVSNNAIYQTDSSGTNISKFAFRIHGAATNVRFFGNKIKTTNSRTVFQIDTTDGANSNIQLWDNAGYVTNNRGTALFSGDNSTTAFAVTHGLSVTPNEVLVTTNQNSTHRITATSSTTFTVTFGTAPANGTNNVTVYWLASKLAF